MRAGILALVGVTVLARLASGAAVAVVSAGAPSAAGALSGFSDPVVDARGRVVFLGTSTGLFAPAGGDLVHVFVPGDRLPDERIVSVVGEPALGPGGCLAVRLALQGGGDGIARRCGATVEWIVESGAAGPLGERLDGFGSPVVIGDTGEIAFVARRDDGERGLYRATAGVLVEIARTGLATPRGGRFEDLRPLDVRPGGRVGFQGTVEDGPDGFFEGDGSAVVPVVLVNDPSPVGGIFSELGKLAANASGRWAFRARVTRAGADVSGIFRADVSGPLAAVSPVVLMGDPTPLGGTFGQFSNSLAPAVNTVGDVAFRVGVDGGVAGAGVFVAHVGSGVVAVAAAGQDTVAGVLSQIGNPVLADDGSLLLPASVRGNTAGIFVVREGVVTPLVRSGAAAEPASDLRVLGAVVRETAETGTLVGQREAIIRVAAGGALESLVTLGTETPLGGAFGRFEPPVVDGRGRIVFGADVRGGREADGIFATRGGRVRTVIASGRRAPGGGRFLVFSSGGLDPVLRPAAAAGAVAFQGRLSGKSGTNGLFVSAGGGLRSLARAGQHAPGGGRFASFGSPALRRATDAAFLARVSGIGDVTGVFRKRGGVLRRVAAAGAPTGTRLGGTFAQLDSPAVGRAGIAFRGSVEEPSARGVFLAAGRRIAALVASGDPAPAGGRFTTLDAPAFAGDLLVFRGELRDGAARAGLFRIPARGEAAPEGLGLVGDGSPFGGRFVSFGPPAGNDGGDVVVRVELDGASAVVALVRFAP